MREKEEELGECCGSAAAEFGQQVGDTEEEPDDEQVGAESEQRQRVQQTGL